MRSAVRLAGTALGLGALVAWRLIKGRSTPVSATGPAIVVGVLGILDSFPSVRNGLDRFLGPDLSDAIFDVTSIVSLVLSGNPLGLALRGLEAFQMFTEVRARRAAWYDYERRLETATTAQAEAVIRLETGDRTPLSAMILEGTGTAIGRDGFPVPLVPGDMVAAGAPMFGGPFRLKLQRSTPFMPLHQPHHAPRSTGDDYLRFAGQLSLSYAALTAVATRSLAQTFVALLLVNRRAALIGKEAATTSASARVLRSGITVVGTRRDRIIRLPGVLLLDGPRLLTDGLDVNAVVPLIDSWDSSEILERAAGIAAAAGSPWGSAFRTAGRVAATDGGFDGATATALVDGTLYNLGPVENWELLPTAARLRHRGDYVLLLRKSDEERPLGIIALQPRLASGVRDLAHVCERHGVQVRLLSAGDPVAALTIADHAGVPLIPGDDPIAFIREQQGQGVVVAFASDTARAAEAFAACDLAIGITDGRSDFHARADLIAPDLTALVAVIEAGARREAAVRDAVALSAAANGVGAVWGFRSRPGIDRAPYPVSVAALGTLVSTMVRMRGGEQRSSSVSRLVDPRPERWGRLSTTEVLQTFDTTQTGLSSNQVAQRRRTTTPAVRQHRLLTAVLDQIRSPLTGILAAGAGLSLFLGATGDVVMIGAMIVANAAAGVWQERQADQAAATLERLGTVNARVLRDGKAVVVPAGDVVPGDLLLLARGERVVADARVFVAEGLEVDEAALTGESLPVPKAPSGGPDASRVVLEGSDVIVGTGSAIVVAVGSGTRLGAIAAALAIDETQGQSVLTTRLSRLLRQFLPLATVGGAIVTLSGLLRRSPLLPQVALGASIAIAAVPEGLPLLAKVGEAAVGRRLASRHALVRRLSVVEALGRVDVVCTDKTGTLTEGRLALRLVTDADQEVRLPGVLPASLRHVVVTAALAGPHPDAPDASISPTDVAVVQAVEAAGLGAHVRADREAILPFDAARSFHAAIVGKRLCVEGAAEALVSRCSHVRHGGENHLLDEAGQQELLAKARHLAESGLRVLMVAEGSSDVPVDDPQNLVALGFLGISDLLRPTVPAAIRRCHDAGVRVIMLTGDHPTTAR
ncbi:MAG: HAD-IC family P-type ATPase, partial [Chloroflexota bacterium]|nr:HAD-IC family P-type ATPase [Chloroflexota bacterium]